MDDIAYELRLRDAISRGNSDRLEPPREKPVCNVCHGTGVTLNTGTPDLYGQYCLRGCKIDYDRIKELGV